MASPVIATLLVVLLWGRWIGSYVAGKAIWSHIRSLEEAEHPRVARIGCGKSAARIRVDRCVEMS
jgi:hypothetical protein